MTIPSRGFWPLRLTSPVQPTVKDLGLSLHRSCQATKLVALSRLAHLRVSYQLIKLTLPPALSKLKPKLKFILDSRHRRDTDDHFLMVLKTLIFLKVGESLLLPKGTVYSSIYFFSLSAVVTEAGAEWENPLSSKWLMLTKPELNEEVSKYQTKDHLLNIPP